MTRCSCGITRPGKLGNCTEICRGSTAERDGVVPGFGGRVCMLKKTEGWTESLGTSSPGFQRERRHPGRRRRTSDRESFA